MRVVFLDEYWRREVTADVIDSSNGPVARVLQVMAPQGPYGIFWDLLQNRGGITDEYRRDLEAQAIKAAAARAGP